MMENPTVISRVMTEITADNKVYKEIEVEVLTVHFNTGSMRVRYIMSDYFGTPNKKRTDDVPNQPFLDKYFK